jgi:hypothetical protein
MSSTKTTTDAKFKPYWKSGKATIPLRIIRAAVKKVRQQELARKKRAGAKS